MIRTSLLALALAGVATVAAAQEAHSGHRQPQPDPHAGHGVAANPHAGHEMPIDAGAHQGQGQPEQPQVANPHAGHVTPSPAADPHAGHTMPAPATAADPHADHKMPREAADPHAGHTMPMTEAPQAAAQQPVGSATAPPVVADNAADAVYGKVEMDRARRILGNEHGASRVSKVMANLLEYQARDGQDGYRWDVEAWWGGDINRLVLKSEGEGVRRDGIEDAEIQVLYSRAFALYTDLQIGVRHDFEPDGRTYATLGLESVFPYWFEAEGALFLSDKGDLLARLEGSYDFRLSQRLVLQPEAELDFAAQDIPESQIGSGLSKAELGLRLRYEIRREFAPYVGVSYERVFGDTADLVRAHGEDVESTSLVIGLRAWF